VRRPRLGGSDGYSNIHAPNESDLCDELEKTALAEAHFFREFAERWRRGRKKPNA
jgi:hypothetical protein